MILIYFTFSLLFCLYVYMHWKESLNLSPYEMVQEQSGNIQQIHDKLSTITLSEAFIDALQEENDQTTDQINQLQENLPSTQIAEAYPEEPLV